MDRQMMNPKLYAELFSDLKEKPEIWSDDGLMKLYIYCVANASHNQYRWRGIQLQPGDLPLSERKTAEALEWSRDKVRRKIRALAELGIIRVESAPHVGTMLHINIAFPLTSDVGKALKDYILNARPVSDCQEVFLSLRPPHAAMMDAVAVGDMFSKYQKKAGIVRQPFDGKGFHGLRRRLAKKLIVNGTPLTTVAQILGHSDLHSVRQYLSLDTGNLRECALDFSGIPVRGGLLK